MVQKKSKLSWNCRNVTNCTQSCSLLPHNVKEVGLKIAEKEVLAKDGLKKNVTHLLMLETLKQIPMPNNGSFAYAFHYLISRPDVPIAAASVNSFHKARMGVSAFTAKGKANTLYACIFGYEYPNI